jgi:hypothetical protein
MGIDVAIDKLVAAIAPSKKHHDDKNAQPSDVARYGRPDRHLLPDLKRRYRQDALDIYACDTEPDLKKFAYARDFKTGQALEYRAGELVDKMLAPHIERGNARTTVVVLSWDCRVNLGTFRPRQQVGTQRKADARGRAPPPPLAVPLTHVDDNTVLPLESVLRDEAARAVLYRYIIATVMRRWCAYRLLVLAPDGTVYTTCPRIRKQLQPAVGAVHPDQFELPWGEPDHESDLAIPRAIRWLVARKLVASDPLAVLTGPDGDNMTTGGCMLGPPLTRVWWLRKDADRKPLVHKPGVNQYYDRGHIVHLSALRAAVEERMGRDANGWSAFDTWAFMLLMCCGHDYRTASKHNPARCAPDFNAAAAERLLTEKLCPDVLRPCVKLINDDDGVPTVVVDVEGAADFVQQFRTGADVPLRRSSPAADVTVAFSRAAFSLAYYSGARPDWRRVGCWCEWGVCQCAYRTLAMPRCLVVRGHPFTRPPPGTPHSLLMYKTRAADSPQKKPTAKMSAKLPAVVVHVIGEPDDVVPPLFDACARNHVRAEPLLSAAQGYRDDGEVGIRQYADEWRPPVAGRWYATVDMRTGEFTYAPAVTEMPPSTNDRAVCLLAVSPTGAVDVVK